MKLFSHELWNYYVYLWMDEKSGIESLKKKKNSLLIFEIRLSCFHEFNSNITYYSINSILGVFYPYHECKI